MATRDSITWEQAIQRFPLALTGCEVNLSDYVLYWSRPKPRSEQIDGIYASHPTKVPWLYYQGSWRKL